MARSEDAQPTGKGHDTKLPEFPGDNPQQHEAKDWLEALDDAINAKMLQEAARGQLPLRVQSIRNWPPDLVQVPAEVQRRMDSSQLYKVKGDAAHRQKENERNNETVRIAVLEDKDALFSLITGTMQSTAPLLRDTLRAKCRISGTDHFDGTAARKMVIDHIAKLATDGDDGDFYQKAEEALRKQENRLPTGCLPQ